MKPSTLGELRSTEWSVRAGESVKDEMRGNLIRKLQAGETVLPGFIGYEDTVIPQIVNAPRVLGTACGGGRFLEMLQVAVRRL